MKHGIKMQYGLVQWRGLGVVGVGYGMIGVGNSRIEYGMAG